MTRIALCTAALLLALGAAGCPKDSTAGMDASSGRKAMEEKYGKPRETPVGRNPMGGAPGGGTPYGSGAPGGGTPYGGGGAPGGGTPYGGGAPGGGSPYGGGNGPR